MTADLLPLWAKHDCVCGHVRHWHEGANANGSCNVEHCHCSGYLDPDEYSAGFGPYDYPDDAA